MPKEIEVTTARDRISVGLTRKFNTAKFESVDIFVNYSSDSNPDETPQAHYNRVAKNTVTWFTQICKHLKTGELKK